ncbi:MAG: bifunctional phosphopantothenoylcysteine decarboxylase/phosphopantothenate--cysteine ligase CoaBC [Acidimicrobiia bacterium]|nr:bifunctional phosphopantothenoylcysteine decarboxylase/phosphopantothenate--cysteine ligase CoaBC [Acidimicrobiia bacterium]
MTDTSVSGRRILLGVSGGVAAYKSVYLARRLGDAGAEVRVVMTETATQFVGTQTFAAVTGVEPVVSLFDDARSVSPHTDLARWPELVVVAPATAATLSRLAHGLSEDALSATLLATTAPIVLAPAMHTEMWDHPATQRSVSLLVADGHELVGPDEGHLAGGDVGAGRMVEPEQIVAAIEQSLAAGFDLAGVDVLVTAGGTREAIDPVRYLGNRSSGKMGHTVATVAARRGANVTLVTTSSLPAPGCEVVKVESAQEMAKAVSAVSCEVAVMAAAVADFRPANASDDKLARTEGPPKIVLEPTPDILSSVVAREDPPLVVGFAAETGGVERAVEKAKRKKVDLMVYNDVTAAGSGFGTDTNQVVFIDADGGTRPQELMSKTEVAQMLWTDVHHMLVQD